MPYISKDRRNEIYLQTKHGNGFDSLVIEEMNSAGDLQYAMAIMFKSYIERKGLNYQHCNDIMGALAGAQMEFYKEVVSKYENMKIEQNGGVY